MKWLNGRSTPTRLSTELATVPTSPHSFAYLKLIPIVCGLCLFAAMGCAEKQAVQFEKAPRPVIAIPFVESTPEPKHVVSGAVNSWKHEQIGFEVGGRVLWVLEPGRDVEGRVSDSEGQLITAGTPLAQIDPTRYQIAVDSAKAALEVSQLEKEGIDIKLNKSIPADLESAQADKDLAESDFERMKRLQQQDAISQSEFDQAKTTFENSVSRLTSLQSSKNRALADSRAASARIKSSNQKLEDAKRDLANTTLFASYRGQISEIQVVPGSVVSAGTPVLTLQMMDPIKIEIELSADQSRTINVRHQLPMTYTLPDGTPVTEPAFVYMIDPSADPTTRTFTLQLLFMNKKYRPPMPERDDNVTIARTQNIWPLNLSQIVGIPKDTFLVEENSIFEEEGKFFVWKVTNAEMGKQMPMYLSVKKLEVFPLKKRIPFLGNWMFQVATFAQPSEVTGKSIIAGELEFDSGNLESWNGGPIFVDSGEQWLLRPGDLVRVNLSAKKTEPGFYVPLAAIHQESDETSIFVIDDNGATVRKLPVNAIFAKNWESGAVVRVEPVNSAFFQSGMKIVIKGAHYLQDGESVRVVESASAQQQ